MISDFSKQIKEGTKKSHSMAENTSFVASFLRGVIDQKNYRAKKRKKRSNSRS